LASALNGGPRTDEEGHLLENFVGPSITNELPALQL
jgi:hypothetical protein